MSEPPVAIITGASSGIGEATARLLARRGYAVVLAARRLERLRSLEQEIQSTGGQALVVESDMSNLGDIQQLVQNTIEEFGKIDVLFNNAGMGRINWLEMLDQEEDIAAQVQVNLTGLIQLTREVLPYMLKRGSGKIINMASVAGLLPVPTYSVYSATKYGVRGFTEALRRELKPRGIDVSGIYPGGTETEFRQKSRRERRSKFRTPDILRMSADEVAQAVWGLIQGPRRALVIPWPMRLAAGVNNLFPGLVEWVIERVFP
jgi:short-subunit dehydrogenase